MATMFVGGVLLGTLVLAVVVVVATAYLILV